MIPTREEIDVSNGTLCAMRDEIPAALKPSEDREAAIRAWEEEALTVESGEEPFGQGYFLLRRSEITAAVALMRSADGKALLRELRAWIIDEKWCAPGIVRKIDEMLAQPAPVEQPAAAVPDDTRELVAQLADVVAEFFVAPWCDRAAEIAAKLRRSK